MTDMVGGGPFHLKPGQWTDDTSMALCLATSLVSKDGFDPVDQMDRYWDWYQNGYLSSTGHCFDIGNTVRQALERYKHRGDPFSGSTDPYSAGNGSLMRLAPIPLFYFPDLEKTIRFAGGGYCQKTRTQIKGTGYVVDSLEAALWCFYQTDSFEAAILQAANLDDDADTTAAICGQIAGAFYGEAKIPVKWLACLFMRAEITKLADQLARQEPRISG